MSSSYYNQAKKSGPGMGGMLLVGGGLLALLGLGYVAMKKGGSSSPVMGSAAGGAMPLPGKSAGAKPGGCGCGH